MAKKQNTIQTLVDARLHALYCGVTMSGKTTLARHHCRLLLSAGHDVGIYDPQGTATAGGDWVPEHVHRDSRVYFFSDPHKFLVWLINAQGEPDHPIFVFVDESADIFGHGNSDNNLIPRKVRHNDVYLRLVSQRPKMLPPNVRSQCAICFMFRLAVDDAKIVCADFGHGSDVAQIPLDTGDFIVLMSGASAIEQANVFELVDS